MFHGKTENSSKRPEGMPTRTAADQYSERRGGNVYSKGCPIFNRKRGRLGRSLTWPTGKTDDEPKNISITLKKPVKPGSGEAKEMEL